MAKGSLTFPSDPLAAMRELSDLDSPPVLTEARKPVNTATSKDAHTELREHADTGSRNHASTGVRTDASTDLRGQGSTGASEEASAEVSKPARAEARTPAPKEARKAASKQVGAGAGKDAPPPVGADGLLAAVEAALESREPLEGGVKATVDMSPELSSRAKRYLADHRGRSTRQVLVALLDAYLAEKGY